MLHRPNKTRAAKEGVIEPSAADLIRPFVAGPDEPPRYALHFGKIDKVGVNPKSGYNTPLAVCAYPLTEEIFDQFLDISLPFAQKDAKYLFVLEIKPDARVFYSTKRFFDQGVGPEHLDADLSKIEVDATDDMTIAEIREASFSKQFFYSTRPSGYYQNKPYFVEGGTAARAAQWGHKLWKMGIDVWVDADEEGILHKNEPSQVMFFNPSSYRVVLSMDNPKNRLQAQFGRDWLKRKDIDVSPADRARGGVKKLRGADLHGADLYGARLKGVDLTDADLRDAMLRYANLTDADLTDAKLFGADLRDATLLETILIRAELGKAKLDEANLDEAILRDAKLREARLNDAKLRYADLTGADLTDANLSGANLYGASLYDATLYGAVLHDADFRRAYLRDVKYDNITDWPRQVQDVLRVWRGEKDLYLALLHDADLSDADLTGVDLTRAKLTFAKLHFAILTDATLTYANLTGAELTGVNLKGAKLTGVDLTGVHLIDIYYDDTTVWPEGFTPPPSVTDSEKLLSSW